MLATTPEPTAKVHDTRLLVAIVAYQAALLTIDCLASIEPERIALPGLRVIVVDNASPDGAADAVAEAIARRGWSGWATLVRSPTNRGFAAGNNVAIRDMLAEVPRRDFVLLLNPDTVVRPGGLGRLLEFMLTHPRAGIAGGRSEDMDGTPQVCCFRFPNAVNDVLGHLGVGLLDRMFERHLTRLGIPEQALKVDWVSGAYMLMRREVIEQIGLMDEAYFLYFEETDYALRVQQAGWECWHVPDSRVVHLVGQSSGVTVRDRAPRRLPAYWYESRRRYFVRHHGRAYAILTDLALALACPVGRLRHRLAGKAQRTPPHFVGDLMRHSALWAAEPPPVIALQTTR